MSASHQKTRQGRHQARRRPSHKSRRGQAPFSIERLRARMLVLAYLDQDYSGELALARSLARAEDRSSARWERDSLSAPTGHRSFLLFRRPFEWAQRGGLR